MELEDLSNDEIINIIEIAHSTYGVQHIIREYRGINSLFREITDCVIRKYIQKLRNQGGYALLVIAQIHQNMSSLRPDRSCTGRAVDPPNGTVSRIKKEIDLIRSNPDSVDVLQAVSCYLFLNERENLDNTLQELQATLYHHMHNLHNELLDAEYVDNVADPVEVNGYQLTDMMVNVELAQILAGTPDLPASREAIADIYNITVVMKDGMQHVMGNVWTRGVITFSRKREGVHPMITDHVNKSLDDLVEKLHSMTLPAEQIARIQIDHDRHDPQLGNNAIPVSHKVVVFP